MAWDLMRGLDVALDRPGADKERVILLGAVAGGGDPAAVTAALDPRVTCVVPFNFGGPQPETRYPLPENAEEWFPYAGGGSWESTRNLRDSAAGGFLPWVIVASVAPRRLIHAHEFSWDRDRDPVWKRYQKVWGFYHATENLSYTTGTGVIHGNDPTASHCTNIGPIHRKGIYAALKKWFDIPVPEAESRERRPASELKCWTEESVRELKPKPLHEVLAGVADQQLVEARTELASLPMGVRGESVFDRMRDPFQLKQVAHKGITHSSRLVASSDCDATWVTFWKAPGPRLRAIVLTPKLSHDSERIPCVFCVCQNGPHAILRERAQVVAMLIRSGVGVVLVEVNGTGQERPGGSRGRTSYATSLSATSQMDGRVLMSLQYSDLTLAFERCSDVCRIDSGRMVLWGESLEPPNGTAVPVAVPYDVDQPALAEPLGPTLLGLCALEKRRVKAVVARGGLVSYRSVLDSPFVHVPHDALPVNVFRAGDLPDVWAQLAPKPLRLEGLVDGTNRHVTGDRLDRALQPVRAAYAKGGLVVKEDYSSDAELAKWMIDQLRK
jgi:hypothetical protein